jgi:hypothetical protein
MTDGMSWWGDYPPSQKKAALKDVAARLFEFTAMSALRQKPTSWRATNTVCLVP